MKSVRTFGLTEAITLALIAVAISVAAALMNS